MMGMMGGDKKKDGYAILESVKKAKEMPHENNGRPRNNMESDYIDEMCDHLYDCMHKGDKDGFKSTLKSIMEANFYRIEK